MNQGAEGGSEPAVSANPGFSKAYSYYVLAVLCLANIFASLDRFAFFPLIPLIKREFKATDTEIGLVSGIAFVAFYALFGIPVARWIDRGNRRNILALSVAAWSLVTMLGGFAANIMQLGLSRAGLGAGEAGATPASNSLISDYFRKQDRPLAVSIFQAGMAFSAIVLGPIVAWIAVSYGWRAGLIAMGAPGMLVALLIFLTVKEPVRGGMEVNKTAPVISAGLWTSFKILFSRRAYAYLVLSQIAIGFAVGVLPVWLPVYLVRAYSLSLPQVAGTMGFLNGAVMLASFAVAGLLGSFLLRRHQGDRLAVLLPATACLLSLPFLIATLNAGSFSTLLILATIFFFLMFISRPAAFSLSIELAPIEHRGLATAIIVIAAALIGGGGGPLLVGMISDHLTASMGDTRALGMALLMTVPVAITICSLSFYAVAYYFHKPSSGQAAFNETARK